MLIAQYNAAQVGINTLNPRTLVHIDGAGTNPPTGNPSAAQMADDIVITNFGNVGVGTYAPTNKLDIRSATVKSLKITDTTQGVNKVLVSDANGVGTWTNIGGSWYAVMLGSWSSAAFSTSTGDVQMTGFWGMRVSNSTQGAVNITTGTITVPFTGKYRIGISGYWDTNRSTAVTFFRAEPAIYRNNVFLWSSWVIGNKSWGIRPGFLTVMDLSANDNITIRNRQSTTYHSNRVTECVLVVEYLR